jgi:hypothetical protein
MREGIKEGRKDARLLGIVRTCPIFLYYIAMYGVSRGLLVNALAANYVPGIITYTIVKISLIVILKYLILLTFAA